MPRQKKNTATPKSKSADAVSKQWLTLTWEDVDGWAGSRSVSRGRSYQKQGNVRKLVLAEDGRLLATVIGSERYVTSVWMTTGRGRREKLDSNCTCPVGDNACKHAVAVVVEFFEMLADEKEVTPARANDPRWAKLEKHTTERDEYDDEFDDDLEDDFDDVDFDDDDDDEGYEEEQDEWSAPEMPFRRGRSAFKMTGESGGRSAKRKTRAEWDEKIRSHVLKKSHEELAELLCTLIDRFPELRDEFQERIALAEGDVDRLVDQARRELRTVSSEIGWRNHWNDEGHTPDYSRLQHKLQRLVDAGHFDPVVKLGEELIEKGINQIEMSSDNGETGTELFGCFPIVFEAVKQSSLSPPDKFLYAIDACMKDDYDMIGDAADVILSAEWQAADWSVVADQLAKRLESPAFTTATDEFSGNYRRDSLSNWLLHALKEAGRDDEMQAICEAEARKTGSYERLVNHLLENEHGEDAQRWAIEGIEKTKVKWPGIAAALREKLCNLARRRKEWDVVAAHAAFDFFERPGVEPYRKLIAAAEKAKCGQRVRDAAQKFLESGQAPVRLTLDRKGNPKTTIDPDWPLPVPEHLAPVYDIIPMSGQKASRRVESRPHFDVLLELAIAEKRPDDVLRWYDTMAKGEKRPADYVGYWGLGAHRAYSDKVAMAVADTHPERALEIYRQGLDANLQPAQLAAYESCAVYLRKMRPIMTSLGRENEWNQLLTDIRTKYRNRPRFMEILEKLDGRTILEMQKSRRRG